MRRMLSLCALLSLPLSGCADDVPPTILSYSATPQQGVPGDTVTFNWSVRDSHAGKLSCTLDAQGDGTPEQTLDDCKATTSWSYTYSEGGAFNATLTVSDKAGNSTSKSLSIVMASPVDLGPGLHLLDSEALTGGAAVLNFSKLGTNETVVVIPIHTDKNTATEAMSFSVSGTGFASAGRSSAQAQSALELPVMHKSTFDAALAQRDLTRAGGSSTQQAGQAGAHPRVAADARSSWRAARRQAMREKHLDHLSDMHAYNQLLSQRVRKSGRRAPEAGSFDSCVGPYSLGKECSFYIVDEKSTQINTVLSYETENAYWFVDENDLSDLSPADFASLGEIFEDTIVPSDNQYFGPFSDVDKNGKIFIVFSNLLWDMGVLGYVYSIDLFTDEEIYPSYGIHSNEGDIFYATSPGPVIESGYATKREYIETVLPATMVHELKHLIAAGVRVLNGVEDEELWIEEGSAQASQELIGLGDSMYYVQPMFQDPQNFNLVYDGRPAGVAGSAIYGYSFTFIWRVAEKLGHDNFWLDWTAGPYAGIRNLEDHTGESFQALVEDWGLTLLLDHTGVLEGYDYESLSLRKGWPDLGISALDSASGHTRSMAYFVGKGSGSDASVGFVSTSAKPEVIVLRFTGELPYDVTSRSGGDLTGKLLTEDSSMKLAGTYLLACPVDDGCTYFATVTEEAVQQKPSSDARMEPMATYAAPFVFPALPGEKFYLYAWKDNDNDGEVTSGDYLGIYTEDGETEGELVPPKSGLEIYLGVY